MGLTRLVRRPAPEPQQLVSVLSAGVTIHGSVTVDGILRIDGSLEGDVSGNGTIVIGPTGAVRGDARGECVTVAGRVDGDVAAAAAVTIAAGAVVHGNVHAARLVVAEGAVLNGRVSMGAVATDSDGRTACPVAAESVVDRPMALSA